MKGSPRKFLVTGAAGFVGAGLCRRLLSEGQEVHAVTREASRRWRLADIIGDLVLHEIDLRDGDKVRRVVADVRPDVIYHLATHGAYPQQTDGEQILESNVMGLWNLLHASMKTGYELLVNTGSSSEYGHKSFAMRETDLLEPDSFYAVAKSAQSLLCQHLSRESGLPIVSLRLFSVYGPWEEPSRLIPSLMRAALEDRSIEMVAPKTARDFVFVEDVLDVYLMVEKLSRLRGDVLNVGTGAQSSLLDVVATMERVAGKRIEARWDSMPSRPWDSEVWVADVSQLRNRTGYSARTSLEEGLAQTYAWVRAQEQLHGRD